MDITKHTAFVLSHNEEKKSYEVILIDWNTLRLNSVFRSYEGNLIVYKCFLNDKYELDKKSTSYSYESDDGYYDKLPDIKKMLSFDDNLELIAKELIKRGYFNGGGNRLDIDFSEIF